MYAKFFSFLLLLFSSTTFQIILRPCNRLRFKNFPYRETDDLLRKKWKKKHRADKDIMYCPFRSAGSSISLINGSATSREDLI